MVIDHNNRCNFSLLALYLIKLVITNCQNHEHVAKIEWSIRFSTLCATKYVVAGRNYNHIDRPMIVIEFNR